MISDERLHKAAKKVEESMLASLPEPEECEATFSPKFERKMKKLIRYTDHPVRHRIMKAAACFLLAILLGGGSVLTLSADARAAFVGWIREIREAWFVYSYSGIDQDSSLNTAFRLSWIPDGYEELSQIEMDDQTICSYKDSNNNLIRFIYTKSMDSSTLYLEHGDVVCQIVQIGQYSADLYLDQEEGNANSLVWSDNDIGILFWLSGNCSGEELIKMAESINREPKK